MRKFGFVLTAVAAGLLAAAGPATAATVAPAAVPVLTYGALNTPAVGVGDLLTSSLTPGTTLSLTTVPSGGVGLFCLQSVWGAAVTSNPAVPATAVLQLLNPFTISSCTDNNPTVTGVTGVSVTGLPDTFTVNGSGAFPLQIIPGSTPFQITVSLTTTGAPVVCTYQASGPLNGNTSLGSAPWRFVNQPFKLAGGTLPACGTAPTAFFTASYSPVIDNSRGGANVFVN
jgi:hypothetical protein